MNSMQQLRTFERTAMTYASNSPNERVCFIDPFDVKPQFLDNNESAVYFMRTPHCWSIYLSIEVKEPNGSIKVHTNHIRTRMPTLYDDLNETLAEVQWDMVKEHSVGGNDVATLFWVAMTEHHKFSPTMLNRIHLLISDIG